MTDQQKTAEPCGDAALAALDKLLEFVDYGDDPAYSHADTIVDLTRTIRAALTGDCGGGDLAALKDAADSAYCRYIDVIDQKCRGTDYKLENAKFSKSDLSAHIQAYELLGFHRGIHHALKALTADNAKRGE